MRFLLAAIISIMVTISLFVLMKSMLGERTEPLVRKTNVPIEIYKIEEMKKPPIKKPKLPKKTEIKPKPQTPKIAEKDPVDTKLKPVINMPEINLGTVGVPGDFGGSWGSGDDGVRSTVQLEAQYPAIALRKNIEGWVTLSFDVNKEGLVENIQVLDSHPKRIFDKSARRSLAKWKYKPAVVDGKPQSTHGLQVTIEFKMDKVNL